MRDDAYQDRWPVRDFETLNQWAGPDFGGRPSLIGANAKAHAAVDLIDQCKETIVSYFST